MILKTKTDIIRATQLFYVWFFQSQLWTYHIEDKDNNNSLYTLIPHRIKRLVLSILVMGAYHMADNHCYNLLYTVTPSCSFKPSYVRMIWKTKTDIIRSTQLFYVWFFQSWLWTYHMEDKDNNNSFYTMGSLQLWRNMTSSTLVIG